MSSRLRVTLASVFGLSAMLGAVGVAAPIEALQPMAFLAGHCWKGDFADGKQSMTYRVRWTRLNDTSYEAWSEMQVKDGWTTMFKLTMKQSS